MPLNVPLKVERPEASFITGEEHASRGEWRRTQWPGSKAARPKGSDFSIRSRTQRTTFIRAHVSGRSHITGDAIFSHVLAATATADAPITVTSDLALLFIENNDLWGAANCRRAPEDIYWDRTP
ncbi:hypothetical protein GWI33_010549 [Rhynchophorus ferrugineus]|uniref:Uncharacterized protein n=1 Tax=Rhynchophorus ferrugineus TaxID=354439 RepID=A0A834MIY0_RHYFE|nr:hypothetical protein GWI33_010549 [Rhynchophorus ferrugineus]